ncbi:hypothetical protein PLESTF_001707400 [Pleodorina starrii]|nr:hypothetical protein PLESTF_001707400 [Pleodorina starrii]
MIRCRCASSRSCRQDSECGPGEFCGVLTSRSDPPTCQPCTACRNNSQAWRGSCAAACPSGALADSGVSEEGPQGQYFVFAAFGIAEHPQARGGLVAIPAPAGTQGGGSGGGAAAAVGVTEDALRLWLGDVQSYVLAALLPTGVAASALAAAAAAAAVQAVSPAARIIPLRDVAARLAAVAPSRDLFCPQLSPSASQLYPVASQLVQTAVASAAAPTGTAARAPTDPWAALPAALPTTVLAGCPCSAAAAASTFRCPAGHRCSRKAWMSLPTDVLTLGATVLLGARCVACEPGRYCPEGTYVEEAEGDGGQQDLMVALDCPEGYFCPNPAEKHECPAGQYCPPRSTMYISCDFTEQLTSPQAFRQNGTDASKILWQVLGNQAPLRGNYCPHKSSSPYRRCRAGHYCPDPSLEVPCPPGHYCRAESIAPTACPKATLCDVGAAAPTTWPAAVAAFCGLALAVLTAAVTATCLDHSKARCRFTKADQEMRAGASRMLRRFVGFWVRTSDPAGGECPGGECPGGDCPGGDCPASFHNGIVTSPLSHNVWGVVEPHVLEVDKLRWIGPGRPPERPVIAEVTGRFEPGQLSAILGPSGCGKSSLLALMGGRASHWPLSGGEVRLNGKSVTHPRKLMFVTGFVPQDDILCSDLTVQENLAYSARLRLPWLAATQSGGDEGGGAGGDAAAGGADGIAGAGCGKDAAAEGNDGAAGGSGDVCIAADARTASSSILTPAGNSLASSSATPLSSTTSGNGSGIWSHPNASGCSHLKGQSTGPAAAGSKDAGGDGSPGANFKAGDDSSPGADGRAGGGGAGSRQIGGSGGTSSRSRTSTGSIVRRVSTYFQDVGERVECRTKERRQLVEEVLEMLDLKMLRNQRVGSFSGGSISGGQRKRVNIGVELVARPPLLLLDEPTSGLDAACCQDVLTALSELAHERRVNVISVVHQPRSSIFRLFDTVMLLDRNGRSVYHNQPSSADAYFQGLEYPPIPKDENVPDKLLDLIMGKCFTKNTNSRHLPDTSSSRCIELGGSTIQQRPAGSVPSGSSEARTQPQDNARGRQQPLASPVGLPATSRDGSSSTGGSSTGGSSIGRAAPGFQTARSLQRQRAHIRPELTEELADVLRHEFASRLWRLRSFQVRGSEGGGGRGGGGGGGGGDAEPGSGRPAAAGGVAACVRRLLLSLGCLRSPAAGRRLSSSGRVQPSIAAVAALSALPAAKATVEVVAEAPVEASAAAAAEARMRSISLAASGRRQQSRGRLKSIRAYGDLLPWIKSFGRRARPGGSEADDRQRPSMKDDSWESFLQLNGEGLLALFRDLGQEGAEVEVLVQGILELTAQQRLQQQQQQEQQQLERVVVGPQQQQQQRQQQQQQVCHERDHSAPPPPLQPLQPHPGRAKPSELPVDNPERALVPTPLAAAAAADAITFNELIHALKRIQTGELRASSRRFESFRHMSSGRRVSRHGSGGFMEKVGELLHDLHGAASGLKLQISQLLVARGSGSAPGSPRDASPAAVRTNAAYVPGGNNAFWRWGSGRSEQHEVKVHAQRKPHLKVATRLSGTGAHTRLHSDGRGSPAVGFPREPATMLPPPSAEDGVAEGVRSVQSAPAPSDSATQMDTAPKAPHGSGDATDRQETAPAASNGRSPAATMPFSVPAGPGGGAAPYVPPIRDPEWRPHATPFAQASACPYIPTGDANSLITPNVSAQQDVRQQQHQQQQQQLQQLQQLESGETRTPGFVACEVSQGEDIVGAAAHGGDREEPRRHKAASHEGRWGRRKEAAAASSTAAPAPRSYRKPRPEQLSWSMQLLTFSRRAMIQSTRGFCSSSMLEVSLLLAAAAAVGANQGSQWGPTDVPGNALMAMLCLAVLAVVQHLRSFSSNRLVLLRERGVGLSPTAYFVARCLVDIPWILIAPIFFSLPYYVITVPRASYLQYYLVGVGVWWWASGLAYIVTVTPLVPHAAVPTTAVLLTLISGALLNGIHSPTIAEARGSVMAEAVLFVSYNRWALEALSIAELDQYLDSHGNVIVALYQIKGICGVDVVLKGGLQQQAGGGGIGIPWDVALPLIGSSSSTSPFKRGYCQGPQRNALVILFCLGLALRVAACLTLKYDAAILSFAFAVWDWLGAKYDAARHCCLACFRGGGGKQWEDDCGGGVDECAKGGDDGERFAYPKGYPTMFRRGRRAASMLRIDEDGPAGL